MLRRVAWALSLALTLLLVQSTFWTAHVPWVLKIVVAATIVFAAIRPGHALLVVAAFIPLSHAATTRVWQAYPFGLSEALTLAFLSGFLWSRRPGSSARRQAPDAVALPAHLLGLVIVASCLVHLAFLQVWQNYPLPFATKVVDFLATEYLTTIRDSRFWLDGLGFVTIAAHLLEGVALMLCARTLCREQPALGRRVTNVVIAAGAGAALLSLASVANWALSRNVTIAAAVASQRWASPAIPSLNTAGGYFVLVAFVAIGTAVASRSRWRWLLPSLAVVLCLTAMSLTRTRAATVAGLVTIFAFGAWGLARRFSLRPVQTLLLAGAVGVAAGVVLVVFNPLDILADRRIDAVRWRVLYAQTAFRMIALRPFFGVGPGQYQTNWRALAPEIVQESHREAEAHNNFLWLAAEFGLVGLGLVLWLLAGALARVWTRLNSGPLDYWFLGVAAGLTTFVVTWLSWQPLSIPQAGFTFWILLGVVVGCSGEPVPRMQTGWRRTLSRIAVAVAVAFVVGSIPVRARQAIAEVDMVRVSYGFENWSIGPDGMRARRTGPRATFFMWSAAREIAFDVAAVPDSPPEGVEVDLLVNGRLVQQLSIRGKGRQFVQMRSPETGDRVWRIDLRVTPAASGGTGNPGANRARPGVRVGEIAMSLTGSESDRRIRD